MAYLVDLDVVVDRYPLICQPGAAERVYDEWSADVMDLIATKGLSELHRWMDVYFRDPTPYYETQVTFDRAGADRVIHDRGIIYGPWLDGSGSRNATTRFKGYPHWRRTRQWLDEVEAPRTLSAEVYKLAQRLNQ